MKEKSYFYDLHCHTKDSPDAPATLERIAEFAKKRGVDGVAITNHNKTYKGPLKIKGVDVIPGVEITTKEGEHLLGYFVSSDIAKKQSLQACVKEIKKQGGFCVLAHPLRGEDLNKERERFLYLVDGVESGNAMDSKNERERMTAVCRKKGLLESAGSDAHVEGQVGMAVIKSSQKLNANNLADILKEGEILVREEIVDFRRENARWKKVLNKIKEITRMEKIPFLKYLFLRFVLRNYLRISNIRLRQINFRHK
jgi:predicted metal-dependent phosphoesterase TrpH